MAPSRHGSSRPVGLERYIVHSGISRVLIIFCGILAIFLSGCAATKQPLTWDLGKEGQTLYYYLVQLEATASGDSEVFEQAGKKLLELAPEESTYIEMADFYVRRGHAEEGRMLAREGLTAYPSSLPLTLIISDTYLQHDDPQKAADILSFFLRNNPENQDAVQELARVYLAGEMYPELDALVKNVPASRIPPYLHYVKARSLLNRNRLAEGEKELRLIIKHSPGMIDAWVNLGITLQLQNKFIQALPMFKAALERDPDNPGLWLRLIDAQLRAKQPEAAIKTLRSAPVSSSFILEAAMLFVETKHYAAARKLFQEVRDTPDAPEEVYIYLAALAMEHLNNPSEALRELASIPAQSPLAERALRWRMQIMQESGKITQALPIAEQFAKENPNTPEFQIIYAQVMSMTGDNETSIAILRDAKKKWPNDPSVAFFLATQLDAAQKTDEAMQLMEFVLTLEPANAMALNYVGYTLADAGKDLERAHGLLVKAVTEAPEDPHIADSLAWLLYRLGKYDESWTAIQKSIALGGDHPVIWDHYGDIAHKVGHIEQARKGYTNALKLNPNDPEAIKAKLRELQ